MTAFVFNTYLLLMYAILVMWMAAGFTMLEAGSVSSRNASVICLKNLCLYAVAGGSDGKIRLRLPTPDPRNVKVSTSSDSKLRDTVKKSYFLRWMNAKLALLFRRGDSELIAARYERLRRRPGYENLLDAWRPTGAALHREFAKKNLPPVFEDALEFTAFALDQFKERTDRDDVSLVILASHRMKMLGKHIFDRMHALAKGHSIPVIDQYDYMLRRGAEPREAEWTHDQHWNPAGHRWAAKAVLDYVGHNPAICGLGDGLSSTSPGEEPT